MASRVGPETSFPPSHPLPTKVYSISTTNENKGVSITRSHEVHGKSSTDGTSSTAGRSGNLPPGEVEKIKNSILKHKELTEKLKKKMVRYSHNLFPSFGNLSCPILFLDCRISLLPFFSSCSWRKQPMLVQMLAQTWD